MERPRFIPYDTDTAYPYRQLPEFSHPLSPAILSVSTGRYVVGNTEQDYVSEGFLACTGFIIKGEDSRSSISLFHASPLPLVDLDDYDYEKLRPLAGGQVIELKGSDSTPKSYILSSLKRRLGIEHVSTISVNTRKPTDRSSQHYHVAFRPQPDEILIARVSHKDLLVFPGFTKNQTE